MKRDILDTKFLVLAKIAESQPHSKQIDIAEELDLTPQAVFGHIQKLKQENLINSDSNNLFVTKKGVQWIINSIEEVEKELEKIKKNSLGKAPTKVIATDEINKGDEVALYLEEGVLKAKKGKGDENSIAIADSSGKKNDVIKVKQINDIIELEEGSVEIFIVSSEKDDSLGELIEKECGFDEVFTFGMGAISFAQKSSIDIDVKFPTSNTLINYIQRGIDCLVLCEEEKINELTDELVEKEIEYDLIEDE